MLNKALKGIIILVVGLGLLGTGAQAVEIHVDQKSQVVEANGSIEAPFKTIAQASGVLNPGDVCYIHEGVYREVLEPERSGEVGAPITYIAYGQDKVIITATEPVTGWELHEGSIYKTSDVSLDLGELNMIYWGSKAQQLARWPNDLDGNPFTFDALKIKTSDGTYSDSYISHDDIPSYWTSGVMFWLGAHGGCAVQRNITGLDTASNRLSFTPFPTKWPFGTHSPNRWEDGHRGQFFLMNRFEALDAPGEWFWDSDTKVLYYMTPDGQMPIDGKVEFAARERSLQSFQHHIVYRNLNFFGGSVQLNGNYQKLDRCRVKNCVNGLIADSESATAGGAAVLIYGSNVTVENSLIEEGSASGINIGMNAADGVVQNCVVRNFDKQGNHCAPIRSNGPRAIITRNKFSGSARDCTRVTGNDSEFGYNDVSDALISCQDGGLFYVTGQSIPKNIELHHNWFYNAYSPDYTGGKATGIYLDNDSAGYHVHHNVVWDVEWGGLHFNWDALENHIYHNTFWNVGIDPDESKNWAVILCWVPERNGVRTNVRNNVLVNNLSDQREWWDSGAGSFKVDETLDNTFINNLQSEVPPFVDFEKRNFEPLNNSHIVDAGQLVEGVNDNFNGNAPDVGAYEAGGVRWIPGPDWTPVSFGWFEEVPSGISSSDRRLSVMDFTTIPGQTEFGVLTEGVIKLKSASETNGAIMDQSLPSPHQIDFEWTGLSLDSTGEHDDTLGFTLVIEGSQDDFESYADVRPTAVGWGVADQSISGSEQLQFRIANLSLSDHTNATVNFTGFEGVQCKKLSQVLEVGSVGLWINQLPLFFEFSDTEINPRGVGFNWPLVRVNISTINQTSAEFTVNALNFGFQVSSFD